MKIPLTKGKWAIIDDDDFHLSRYKWHVKMNNYASRRYFREDGKQRDCFLHHAIKGFPLYGKQIDHINGDKLDNRKENLRIVTHQENMHNRKCHRDGSKKSKYIGVWKHKIWNGARTKQIDYWESMITINGKRKYVGRFRTEEEAHNAYQNALKEAQCLA